MPIIRAIQERLQKFRPFTSQEEILTLLSQPVVDSPLEDDVLLSIQQRFDSADLPKKALVSRRVLEDPLVLIGENQWPINKTAIEIFLRCCDFHLSAADNLKEDQCAAIEPFIDTKKARRANNFLFEHHQERVFSVWRENIESFAKQEKESKLTTKESMRVIARCLWSFGQECFLSPNAKPNNSDQQRFLDNIFTTFSTLDWTHLGTQINPNPPQEQHTLSKEKEGAINNLFRNSLSQRAGLQEFITLAFSRLGIPQQYYIQSWRNIPGFPHEQDDYVMLNLVNLIAIESSCESGAIESLRKDFGITHFSRYPKNILIQQYNERNDTSSPYALSLSMHADYERGMDRLWLTDTEHALRTEIVEPNHNSSQHHLLRIIECGSFYEIGRRLIELSRRYGQEGRNRIPFLMVNSHGNEELIALGSALSGKRHIFTPKHLSQPGIQRGLRVFFTDDVAVFLSACHGAKRVGPALQNNLGENAIVYASNQTTYSTSVNPYLDQSGRPCFHVTFDHPDALSIFTNRTT